MLHENVQFEKIQINKKKLNVVSLYVPLLLDDFFAALLHFLHPDPS